jgi:hypothetical protein
MRGADVRVELLASVRLVLSVSAAAEAAQTHDLDVREISHPPLTWEFSGPAAQVVRLVRDYAASARAGAPAEEPR